MKKLLALIIALLYTVTAYSQNTLRAVIKDARTDELLPGASLKLVGTTNNATADNKGTAILYNIPNGKQTIEFSFLGYEQKIETITFPLSVDKLLYVSLNPSSNVIVCFNDLPDVVITTTRTSRTINNTPTRVEVISGEELDEKGNMKPGDIRMLLSESTGIQTQQTSATSGNSSIRIQGLDGKYTQIIRDGFPLYSGFSGGLGLLQIAPLDLKQVEVIKGSSSTLYGGGAIAGLVNLVSKTPTNQRQLNFLLNGTSARGLDVSGFYGERSGKIGATVYAAYNHGSAYDPAGIDLTAIPKFDRYTLNPRLFFYLSDKTTVITGINATVEDRIGGDLHYINGNGDARHSYFEQNKTGRYSTQASLQHRVSKDQNLLIKNSVSLYDRTINLPGYTFAGSQISTFSEATYETGNDKVDWVTGLNLLTDNFAERNNVNSPLRNYNHTTIGGFVQNTWNATKKLTLESGLRGDHHNQYGFFVLPRLSALLKLYEHFTTRLGGGIGYKAPTVFTEDAERVQFRNVLPIDVPNTRAERSYGINYDINYKTGLFDNEVTFSLNQLFFYTKIESPIVLTMLPSGYLQYQQPTGHLDTRGAETNLKLTYADLKLFVGYTLADVGSHTAAGRTPYTLVSKHRLNNVLMYEIEDKLKLGLEAYYFSPQRLNDGSTGRGYWTAGFMAEKLWERFSVFINFENFTDIRQTKFGTVYTGSITDPTFRDIYAPLDGFVMNGGIKLRL